MKKRQERNIKQSSKPKTTAQTKTNQPSVSFLLSSSKSKEKSNNLSLQNQIKTKYSSPSLLQINTENSIIPLYQHIIGKLFKFLKNKLPFDLYTEIKAYFHKDLFNIEVINKDESLSSLFETQSWVKTNNTNVNHNKTEEKKLKLSYDLNNSLKVKAKSKGGVSNIKKAGKEIHSLYNICKTGHKLINININPSQTESNSKSKSKSKSKSTSREFSSNHHAAHHHHQYQLISSNLNKKVIKAKNSLINKSQPLLNGKLFSKMNICPYPKPKLLSNKVDFTQGNQPLGTNITGAALFKTNICSPTTKSNQTNNNNNTTHLLSSNKDSHQKVVMSYLSHNIQLNKKNTSTIQFHNKPLATNNTTSTVQTQMNQNKTINSDTRKNTNIDNNDNNNNNSTNSHRNKQIGAVATEYADLNSNKTNTKNDEQIKEIKSTLDDNLKVMFNFSYENFLSKESETESKNNSIQELNSNEFSDSHYHTINHKSK